METRLVISNQLLTPTASWWSSGEGGEPGVTGLSLGSGWHQRFILHENPTSVLEASSPTTEWNIRHLSLAQIMRIVPFIPASVLRHVVSTNLPKKEKENVKVATMSTPRLLLTDRKQTASKDTLWRAGNKGICTGCGTELGWKVILWKGCFGSDQHSSIWFVFALQGV